MKNYYDIAIIGGGIGGLMTAYRLTENSIQPTLPFRSASSKRDTPSKSAPAPS